MKYKLLAEGVRDTETGDCIPFDEGNRHFHEYMLWCAEGNSPEPEFTAEELAAKADADELQALREEVKHIDRSLLRLIIRMYQALAANGHITKADIGNAYVDGAVALRDKLAIVEASE
jgi:hypothetical protein